MFNPLLGQPASPVRGTSTTLEAARLTALRYSTKEIAAYLNVSVTAVNNLKRSPLFKEKVKELQESADKAVVDLLQRLQNLGPDAIERLEEILAPAKARLDEDGNEIAGTEVFDVDAKTRAFVAKEVLDRIGVRGAQSTPDVNIVINNMAAQMSEGDAVAMLQQVIKVDRKR